MSSELVKFDISTLRDQISGRIKSAFVELIPEDAFKQVVQTEINAFFEDQVNPHAYGQDRLVKAPFKKIIAEELDQRFREHIRVAMAADNWNSLGWDRHGNISPIDFVKDVTRQLIPDIIEHTYGKVVQDVADSIRGNL